MPESARSIRSNAEKLRHMLPLLPSIRGVDPLGIGRALWADIRRKGVTQGGSTITQQYVKNAYVGTDYTLWRKIREAVISVKIERKFNKNQILERYLNTVYFGNSAYGLQAAAERYYQTDVDKLTLGQAILLAGLIRNPVYADPYNNPEDARGRRDVIIDRMARLGHVSVSIDRLGYDDSGHPQGHLTCIGSSADVTHQLVQHLRAGTGAQDPLWDRLGRIDMPVLL